MRQNGAGEYDGLVMALAYGVGKDRSGRGGKVGPSWSQAASTIWAMASRWLRLRFFTSNRARHRSALSMVIAALARALVTMLEPLSRAGVGFDVFGLFQFSALRHSKSPRTVG